MTAAFKTIRIARTAKAPISPNRLAGYITAGAVTLSLILATALPARAGDRGDDLAKALIAAVVIGAIIHETKRDDPAPAPVPEPVRKKKGHFNHGPDKRIPAVCALQFEGDLSGDTYYPERCLRREGVRGRLPASCAKDARIYGKHDRIYSERCLRRAGFDMPRKHYRY